MLEIQEFQATGVISKTKQGTKANSVLPVATSHTETVDIEVTAKVPQNICFDKK